MLVARGERGGGRRGVDHLHPGHLALEQGANALANYGMVVNDEAQQGVRMHACEPNRNGGPLTSLIRGIARLGPKTCRQTGQGPARLTEPGGSGLRKPPQHLHGDPQPGAGELARHLEGVADRVRAAGRRPRRTPLGPRGGGRPAPG